MSSLPQFTMRIIFFVLLSIIAFTAQSTSTTQFENNLFYCPEQISCDEQGECTFVSEHEHFFKYLNIPDKVEIGIYKFYKTEYIGAGGTYTPSNWPKEQFTYNKCTYKSSYNLPIDLIVYNGNNIQPLMENWTSWSTESFFRKNCLSDMSTKCPLVKNEGILFERFMRNERGEILTYNDPQKTPIPVDLKVSIAGNTNPAHTLWHISHETLINYCKSSAQCKLTIHYAMQKDRVYHQSDIIIDLTHNDQIIDILPSNGKSYLTVKINPIVTNTIIFEYQDLNIKKQEAN